MSALFIRRLPNTGGPVRSRRSYLGPPARVAGPCFARRPVSERRTMRVSGFSQKLFLIAWAALSAIATIGWLYFIAMSFRFIIDLL
jgi:hypothetical protein